MMGNNGNIANILSMNMNILPLVQLHQVFLIFSRMILGVLCFIVVLIANLTSGHDNS